MTCCLASSSPTRWRCIVGSHIHSSLWCLGGIRMWSTGRYNAVFYIPPYSKINCKIGPENVTRLLTCSLTWLLTHSFTWLFAHPLIYLIVCSLTHLLHRKPQILSQLLSHYIFVLGSLHAYATWKDPSSKTLIMTLESSEGHWSAWSTLTKLNYHY